MMHVARIERNGRAYIVAVAANGSVWERVAAGQGVKRRPWMIVREA